MRLAMTFQTGNTKLPGELVKNSIRFIKFENKESLALLSDSMR